jgi:hypothetical protein
MRDQTSLADLPTPGAIQRELGRVLREATILRRLLKLSLAEQERKAKDNTPNELQGRDGADRSIGWG